MQSFLEEQVHHLEREREELRGKLEAAYGRIEDQSHLITRLIESKSIRVKGWAAVKEGAD